MELEIKAENFALQFYEKSMLKHVSFQVEMGVESSSTSEIRK